MRRAEQLHSERKFTAWPLASVEGVRQHKRKRAALEARIDVRRCERKVYVYDIGSFGCRGVRATCSVRKRYIHGRRRVGNCKGAKRSFRLRDQREGAKCGGGWESWPRYSPRDAPTYRHRHGAATPLGSRSRRHTYIVRKGRKTYVTGHTERRREGQARRLARHETQQRTARRRQDASASSSYRRLYASEPSGYACSAAADDERVCITETVGSRDEETGREPSELNHRTGRVRAGR